MSFARFGPDSDVYLFFNGGGWLECCGCLLRGRGFFENLGQVLEHVKAHVAAGHKVPAHLLEASGWLDEGQTVNLDEPFCEEFGMEEYKRQSAERAAVNAEVSRKEVASEDCTKCYREATFDSPERLCDLHWAQWWVAGLEPTSPSHHFEFLRETLAVMGSDVRPVCDHDDLSFGPDVTECVTCGGKWRKDQDESRFRNGTVVQAAEEPNLAGFIPRIDGHGHVISYHPSTRCDRCDELTACVGLDSSDDEYGPTVICPACVKRIVDEQSEKK